MLYKITRKKLKNLFDILKKSNINKYCSNYCGAWERKGIISFWTKKFVGNEHINLRQTCIRWTSRVRFKIRVAIDAYLQFHEWSEIFDFQGDGGAGNLNDARRDKGSAPRENDILEKKAQSFGGNQPRARPGLAQVFHKFPQGTVRISLGRSRVCFKNETKRLFEVKAFRRSTSRNTNNDQES